MRFDLHDLTDPDHVVESVETLPVTGTGTFASDLGYFSWSPPHPCFLKSVTFDFADLPFESEELVYLATTSTIGRGAAPHDGGWIRVRDRLEVAEAVMP